MKSLGFEMKATENVYIHGRLMFNLIADEKVSLHCRVFAITPEWILLLQFHDGMTE